MQPPDHPVGILQDPSEIDAAQGSDFSSDPWPDLRWKQATLWLRAENLPCACGTGPLNALQLIWQWRL